jgi:hypothetical protein
MSLIFGREWNWMDNIRGTGVSYFVHPSNSQLTQTVLLSFFLFPSFPFGDAENKAAASSELAWRHDGSMD